MPHRIKLKLFIMDLQKLFDHLHEQHDLLLLTSEMYEIIEIVKEIISERSDEARTLVLNEQSNKKCGCCGSMDTKTLPSGVVYCYKCHDFDKHFV